MSDSVPVINLQRLVGGQTDRSVLAKELNLACREFGFFYIIGHGISVSLQTELETLSQQFFALPEATKMKIRMELGGRAWRGFFPVGEELTAGKPDLKEGLYLGTELGPEHPKVAAGIPLHGANLFPEELPRLKATVLTYMEALTNLGHQLMRVLSLSLGLDADYFHQQYTHDPLTLFRIFHYPAQAPNEDHWGVGEHTDYGVLTILKQDAVGGLQIRRQNEWIEAPFIPNSFVCNIGDMLDRMTGGYYRSTPHRVLNRSGRSRLSFPFFFDPNFDVEVQGLNLSHLTDLPVEKTERWDGQDVHAFAGTYGDYVLNKVSKVFPQLKRATD